MTTLTEEVRQIRTIGEGVIYVDENRVEHDALLTIVHGPGYGPENEPTVNLLYVSKDADRSDQYGRQVIRESSVAHCSNNGVYGRCWTARK